MSNDAAERFVWQPGDLEVVEPGQTGEVQTQDLLTRMRAVASKEAAVNLLPEVDLFIESIQDVMTLSTYNKERARLAQLAEA